MKNTGRRAGERGFILITMLVLMSVMMGVAMGMLDSVDNTTQVINYAKRATYARLAAMSAFNYATAYLVRDAAGDDLYTTADALNEDWHMKTHTTGGADAPYTAFTSSYGNGYFVNVVYDLSGRIPVNSTIAQCSAIIQRTPNVGATIASSITASIQKTIGELGENGVSKTVLVHFTPYASASSCSVNLNTLGQLATASGDGEDVSQAILSTGPAGGAVIPRLMGYRRTTLSGTGLNAATTGSLDYNIQRVISSVSTLTLQMSMASSTASYHQPYRSYGTTSSEGYFLIHSKAFLSAAATGTQHTAENRAWAVVKRTSTGFTTLYFRWFWDDSKVILQAP
jgi:hypothetical protein